MNGDANTFYAHWVRFGYWIVRRHGSGVPLSTHQHDALAWRDALRRARACRGKAIYWYMLSQRSRCRDYGAG